MKTILHFICLLSVLASCKRSGPQPILAPDSLNVYSGNKLPLFVEKEIRSINSEEKFWERLYLNYTESGLVKNVSTYFSKNNSGWELISRINYTYLDTNFKSIEKIVYKNCSGTNCAENYQRTTYDYQYILGRIAAVKETFHDTSHTVNEYNLNYKNSIFNGFVLKSDSFVLKFSEESTYQFDVYRRKSNQDSGLNKSELAFITSQPYKIVSSSNCQFLPDTVHYNFQNEVWLHITSLTNIPLIGYSYLPQAPNSTKQMVHKSYTGYRNYIELQYNYNYDLNGLLIGIRESESRLLATDVQNFISNIQIHY